MENSTKALIMAGGGLIALLIISAGVILYRNFAENAEIYEKQPETVNLEQINVNFEKYVGQTNLTIHDVVTVYNFIKENKDKIPYTITEIINISGVGEFSFTNLTQGETIEQIKKYNPSEYRFECNEVKYNEKGQVVSIKFKGVKK